MASCPPPPLPLEGEAGIEGGQITILLPFPRGEWESKGGCLPGVLPSSHQRWQRPGTFPAALPHLTLPKVGAGAERGHPSNRPPSPHSAPPKGEQGSEGGRERGMVARPARGVECERLDDQYYTTGGRSGGRKGRRFSSLTPPSCLLTRVAQGGGWEDERSYFPAAS